MKLVIIAVALTLAGCSSLQWRKEGVPLAQAQKDKQECRYEGLRSQPASYDPLRDLGHEIDVEYACMEVRGYRRAP